MALTNKKPIDVELAKELVARQFPEWKNLEVKALLPGGWDHRTFRLGDRMIIRMPSAEAYGAQIEKESKWLPKLAPLLPLKIPKPVATGQADEEYPFKWAIYEWIEGETAVSSKVKDPNEFARDLGGFLKKLQLLDTQNVPAPGSHNFYRGGKLSYYQDDVEEALKLLQHTVDQKAAQEIWERAISSKWEKEPVWIHGDVSGGNLLTLDGKLSAVIDWGMLAAGDPACDLAISWTLFRGGNRSVFKEVLDLDEATWARGRGWTLWKALIVASGLSNTNPYEAVQSWQILQEVIEDHKNSP